jgi:hypothetical protein
MAQFSPAENKILESISLADIIAELDFQEFMICKLIFDGYNTGEIAGILHCSRRWTNMIMQNIKTKLTSYLKG